MVIVLLANGFEELEALTPVDVLRRNDIDVRTVSVTNDKLVTGTHGIQVAADLTASEVPLNEIDMLILPGGMPGVKNLDATPITKIFIDATLRNRGHLAAICAAPSIFGKHGMLTNIKVTCFPGFEKELLNAIITDTDVITDGVFTTARDYKSAMAFAGELVKICEILGIDPNAEARLEEAKKQELLKINEAPKKAIDFSNYKMPSTDILTAEPEVVDNEEDVQENANTIINTLASFNVTTTITAVTRGPRVTRYELVPARGVKVNAITNLFNDIALNLAREGVRMEAPIPGKCAIGIEVPNKCPRPVHLRALLESDEFRSSKSKTFVAIGRDVEGNNVFDDVAKYPHAVIAGATGMGKSVCINSILASMLYKSRPDELKLILIDPKKVELNLYAEIPHLLVPIITDAKEAAAALGWVADEMELRYELLEKAAVRNIDSYNEAVKSSLVKGDILPKIVIVIDELADLMMQVRNPVEDLIMRIAQKARATGIHLIVGTQRPSVQVITGAIKANIPTRLSFKVSSAVDSRTIIDMSGAEKLLNNGDMLYHPINKSSPVRVQSAFVSDSEIEKLAAHIKSQVNESAYDDAVYARIKEMSKSLRAAKAPDEEPGLLNDRSFLDAVEITVRSEKISTAFLQRKLSIGYGKAAKYIDAMEEIGIISGPVGQKPRNVLITLEEWKEKLSRINAD